MPTGQPSVRSVTAAARSRVQADVCRREDLLGTSRVQGQIVRRELQRVTGTPAAAAGEAAQNDSPRPVESPQESPRSPR